MLYLMIRHRVADLLRWRPVYDAHAPTRRSAGLEDVLLLQSAGDPQDVTLLYRVSDRQRAEAFGQSADLREAMEKAGVLGQPEVRMLEEA